MTKGTTGGNHKIAGFGDCRAQRRGNASIIGTCSLQGTVSPGKKLKGLLDLDKAHDKH